MLKEIVIVGAIAFVGAVASAAPMTPQNYCASLPAGSCEVLNIDSQPSTSSSTLLFIKYCKNGNFSIATVSLLGWQIFTPINTNNNIISGNGGSASSLCPLLP